MRGSLAAIAFLTVTCAFGQDLAKPISYTTKAVPLRVVVEALSKQSGVKLQATSDMEEEPLILRLKDVALKEAMDKIGEVFVADWVDHHGYWRLERSDERIAELRKAFIARRAEAIRASLEQMKAQHADDPAMTADHADVLVKEMLDLAKKRAAGADVDNQREMTLYAQLPGETLATAILLAMDPKELASIPIGKRVVFSSHPNAVQKPLPEFPDEVIDAFNASTTHINVSFKKNVTDQERGYLTYLMRISQEPIARIVMASTPFPHDDHLALEFKFLDAKGKLISDTSLTIGINELIQNQTDYAVIRQQAQKDGFELGPIAREIAPHVGRSTADLRPLSKDAQAILLHPVEHDPLSIATSDLVLTAAERAKMNAVCLAPDEAEYYALNAARQGKTSLEAFRVIAEKQCAMQFSEKDGWLIIKPNDPLDTASARLPRELLQLFLQGAVEHNSVSIDLAADLCGAAPLEASFDLAAHEVQYMLPKADLSPIWGGPDMLRFLGSLSDAQREAASKGTLSIPVDELDDKQLAIANMMVFNAFNAMQQTDLTPGADPNIHLVERTDFLPQGLSGDMRIEIVDERKQVAYALETQFGGGSFVGALPLEALASCLAQSEHPELFPVVNPTKIEKLGLGGQRRVTIRISEGSKSVADSIQEEREPDGDLLSIESFLSSLPEDQGQAILAEVERILQRQRQHYANRPSQPAPPQPTDGGGKPPTRV